MTFEKFLHKLQQTGWALGWKSDSGGGLRSHLGGCPITEVCRVVNGKSHALNEYLTAADLLGMPEELARNIMTAADGETQNPYIRPLREQMLTVINL